MGLATSPARTMPPCSYDETGNIFNATLIHADPATPTFNAWVDGVGVDDCVGYAHHEPTAIYMPIWFDNPLTPEKDGLTLEDTLKIAPFTLQPDDIIIIKSARRDTILSALIDSLQSEVVLLSSVIDSTQAADDMLITQLQNSLSVESARADSLQEVINGFPDVADLQQRVDSLSTRNSELEASITEAQAQFSLLFAAIRSIIANARQ